MKRKRLAKGRVLNICRSSGLFKCHRMKYSQSYLKGICKQLTAEGKIEYIKSDYEYNYFKPVIGE